MNEDEQLKIIRDQLDTNDDSLLELLNKRMSLVKFVGEIKHKSGGALYRPEREKQIIERLSQTKNGILNKDAIEAIFLEIFAISRNLERPENIAFQLSKVQSLHLMMRRCTEGWFRRVGSR